MRLRKAASTGHAIAVIDDDVTLVATTTRLLSREGHEVRSATTTADAIDLLRRWRPQLVLLDYHLGDGTAEAVVRALRGFDALCQVLLVTGYAAEQPARKLLAELDIQGYHDKGDGPDRLMVLVDAALKYHRAMTRLDDQRRRMRHILEIAPEISKLQPIGALLERSLRELGVLLRGGDGFIATTNSGLFVLGPAAEEVSIRAAIGRFATLNGVPDLPEKLVEVVRGGLSSERPFATSGFVVVPLRTRDADRGCMIIEAADLPEDAVEPCQIYGRQVVQAMENVVLYEHATVDALTGLSRRSFGLDGLEKALRLGARLESPTSVLMLDVDNFKALNDTYGHAAGDQALLALGAVVRETCRAADLGVRYGGEEILVVLPATDDIGAVAAAERLRGRIAAARAPFEGYELRFTASVGVATARPHDMDGVALIRRADEALYRAKAMGRNRVCVEEARHVAAA